MIEYGYEMQREFERGWAEFQRKEKRRARLRSVLKSTMRFAGYAIGVAFVTAVGAMVWICVLFPDYECERIFREWGLLWAR